MNTNTQQEPHSIRNVLGVIPGTIIFIFIGILALLYIIPIIIGLSVLLWALKQILSF